MKSLDEIRADLRLIQYYFAHEKMIKNPARIIGHEDLGEKIKRYNAIAKLAPRRLAQVYEELYRHYKTQKVLSLEWGVTEKYIQILNKRLLLFLQLHLE